MKHFTLAAALLCATAIAPTAYAEDDKVSFSTGVDYVSEYVFRGVSLGGNSIQPYTEVSVGNFTAGAWYSVGFGAESDVQGDELDLYAGYSVPLDGPISIDLGATYYHYPQGGALFQTKDGGAGTYEVSASLGFGDVALSPSVTAYYDFTLEAFTFEGGVGHSFDLEGDGLSIDLGATAGHVEADGGGDYQWGTASVALNKAISDDVGVYVSGNFALNSEDDTLGFDRDANRATSIPFATTDSSTQFWLGTGISVGF